MGKTRRFPRQMRQEQISRHQLSERFVEFGWLPTATQVDLGEDFIVHIYFEGCATGVTFHVQEKSVTNLKERQKGDFLVYDFEVKDLKHWEAFHQPVVLVIWDTKQREGRWALLSSVISELDRRRPKWRTNKSKTRARIPWDNTTDDTGLMWLQQSIGWYLYPLITRGKSLEMGLKLQFPDTEEGRAALQAVEHFYRTGEEVAIEGKFIQSIDLPEWAAPWYGAYDPDKALFVAAKTLPMYIQVANAGGEKASTTAELRIVKARDEVVELSNDHQTTPLHFHFTLYNPRKSEFKGGSISIRLDNMGRNACETRDVMRFLQIANTGGTLSLTRLTSDNGSLTMTLLPAPEGGPDLRYLQLIHMLCVIQEKTGQFLQVSDEGLSRADVRAIHELIEIVEQGKTVTRHAEATGEFRGPALDMMLDAQRKGESIHLRVSSGESYVELLGQRIQTGRMIRYLTGKIEMPVTELEEATVALSPGEYLKVRFVDVEVTEIFPDWFHREARRLSQHLIEDFGAESVYLFGSLAWSDIYAAETDIDLAVCSLPPERYLEAVSYLERESGFPVDLVDLSRVPDHLRQRIVEEGRLVGGREAVAALG